MTKKSHSGSHSHKAGNGKWSASVTTDSTHPPQGLFQRDAKTVADKMAEKDVSPKGIGSGIKMIQFYINRAGKNLSAAHRRELERAKRILQDRLKKTRKAK